MSAFVVSRNHMAAIIRYYVTHKDYTSKQDSAVWMANLLMAENVRSFNHRYPFDQCEDAPSFTLKEILNAPHISIMDCLKLSQSLDYQSCETDDWEETEAYRLLNKIKDVAIRDLPGWNKAAWTID